MCFSFCPEALVYATNADAALVVRFCFNMANEDVSEATTTTLSELNITWKMVDFSANYDKLLSHPLVLRSESLAELKRHFSRTLGQNDTDEAAPRLRLLESFYYRSFDEDANETLNFFVHGKIVAYNGEKIDVTPCFKFLNSDKETWGCVNPTSVDKCYGYNAKSNYHYVYFKFVTKQINFKQFSKFLKDDSLYVSCDLEIDRLDDSKYRALNVDGYLHFKNVLDDDASCDVTFTIVSLNVTSIDYDDDDYEDDDPDLEVLHFPAHKAVLESFSRRCVNVLRISAKGENDVRVVIRYDPNVDPVAFHAFIKFIYTNEIDDLDDVVDQLLYLANVYQVDELRCLCENHVVASLTVSSALLTLIRVDNLNNALDLKDKVLSFIRKNVIDVTRTEQFNSNILPAHLIDEIYALLIDARSTIESSITACKSLRSTKDDEKSFGWFDLTDVYARLMYECCYGLVVWLCDEVQEG